MKSSRQNSNLHHRALGACAFTLVLAATTACGNATDAGVPEAHGGSSATGTGGTTPGAGAAMGGMNAGSGASGGASGSESGAAGSGGTASGSAGSTGAASGSAGTESGNGGAASGSGGASGNGGGTAAGGATDVVVGPNPTAATRAICTGTDPISCHFGGQPGNYDVTVVLGGAAAGNTIVQAERARGMLLPVATSAGQTRRFTFTVNVRQPEGEPIQPVPAGTPGLDVYFLGNGGAAPQLNAIGFAAAPSPFMIYVAGDSTVCDQGTTAYGGWAQQIPAYFNYPVSIANYADSGESSASFLASASLFGAISSRLKANDWVFIQFGHNDKTVTATQFHDSMTALVAGVKAKRAFPVLVTPVARATFSGNTVTTQHVNSTGANLPAIIKQVGSEQGVPVLDMTARTVVWLNQLGPNGWQQYHALGTDMTHTNPAGAAVEAGFVVDLIKQANLTPLVSRLR